MRTLPGAAVARRDSLVESLPRAFWRLNRPLRCAAVLGVLVA